MLPSLWHLNKSTDVLSNCGDHAHLVRIRRVLDWRLIFPGREVCAESKSCRFYHHLHCMCPATSKTNKISYVNQKKRGKTVRTLTNLLQWALQRRLDLVKNRCPQHSAFWEFFANIWHRECLDLFAMHHWHRTFWNKHSKLEKRISSYKFGKHFYDFDLTKIKHTPWYCFCCQCSPEFLLLH